jgi:hypothetical protein
MSIQQASSALGDLPEKPKEIWSLREAIDALKDDITLALDRGYTYPEISQMLTTKGVEISASTLKYYLSSVRRQDPNAKPKRRRRVMHVSPDTLELPLSQAAAEPEAEVEAEAMPAETSAPTTATKAPGRRGGRGTKSAAKVTKSTSTKTSVPSSSKTTTPKTPKGGTTRSRKKAV